MNNETNYFTQLAQINVNEHIERKGQFSYLSWPFAVSQLRQFDPTATWEVKRFDGLPYLLAELGTFVEVAVTVRGITLSQIHPVLDSKNRPIAVPTSFDINTSIQRALVKAIALHGLGLYVYAGEDLPNSDASNDVEILTPPTEPSPASVHQFPKPTPVVANGELLTANQLRFIKRLLVETGTDENQLLGFTGHDALDNIPKAEVNRIIKMLESNRKAVA